ncbi:MAG TPA: type II and III secretion system protein family protein [Hyphomicrobium sp.]|nr:type II and III secretion system protein family protein [Hyphomicrobium sp.]
MRKKVGLFASPLLGAVGWFAAGILLVTGSVTTAVANGAGRSADVETLAAAAVHQSVIRVQDTGGAPVRKNIKIGLGKSALVEFPRDVRDVMVSNPAAVDAVVLSANRVFLLARKIGEANAFFFDTTGEQFATFEIFIERETAGLENLLNRLITGSNIKVEMLNQTVVLTGSVKNPTDSVRAANIARQFVNVQYETTTKDKADGATIDKFEKSDTETVINMLTVEAEEQVMLKVTVAEVQRSLLKQLGVNLGGVINAGNFTTALLTENALPLTAAAGLGTLPLLGMNTKLDDKQVCGGAQMCAYNQGPGQNSFGNSGLHGGWNGPDGNSVSHAIRALERDGLIRTLAEPNLTAVSGEPANFLAGGEFPIPLVDNTGQVSVTFKKFGVALAFTPIVLSEGRISLKIETEVSELSNQGAITLSGIAIPALKKREAKSTVELPSGGTLALAGLISDDTRQNIDGLPGAKDIPILGTLFRSRDFIRNETELVVIVTPYLVKATSRQEIAAPGTGLTPATDMKANFLGHLNAIYGKGQSLPDGGLKGDYGYIVE